MRFSILICSALACGIAPVEDGENEGSSGEESSGIAVEPADRSPPRGLAGNDCHEEGQVIVCTLDDGSADGKQACGYSQYGDGPLIWSGCVEMLECVPGEVYDCLPGEVRCVIDGERVLAPGCGLTPLAIDLGGDGFAFEPAGARAFDIAGTGACLDVDWPVKSTAWLALDRDGDGGIADGRELFGSGTPMPDGAAPRDGFVALASLDDDGDGVITRRDPEFARLVLWTDHDGDRSGTAGELLALSQVGIDTLPLAYDRERECDARGNCVVERTSVHTSAGSRPLVDLHLACQ